jgi:TatA/E family protein of Tat protein translocase
MFGTAGHLPELIIILVLGLIILGPGKLPQVGSALGKTIKEFRKSAQDGAEATSTEDAAAKDDTASTTSATVAPVSSTKTTSEPTVTKVEPK